VKPILVWDSNLSLLQYPGQTWWSAWEYRYSIISHVLYNILYCHFYFKPKATANVMCYFSTIII
jgi:hypothetical protein